VRRAPGTAEWAARTPRLNQALCGPHKDVLGEVVFCCVRQGLPALPKEKGFVVRLVLMSRMYCRRLEGIGRVVRNLRLLPLLAKRESVA
jgi:hypothetical protein